MIEPLEDRVLVRLEDPDTKTAGGLILPQTVDQPIAVGTVLAVGPGRHEAGERVPVNVEVGDRVIVHPFAGVEVDIDGETLKLIPGVDVWVKIVP